MRSNGLLSLLFAFTVAAPVLAGCSSDSNSKADAGHDARVADARGADLSRDGAAPALDGAAPIAPEKLVREKSACPAAFQAQAPQAGATSGFEVEGQQRSFVLRLPAASFSGPRPLVVYFHGTGGHGSEIESLGFADKLLEQGAIVVGPDGEDNGTVWPEWDAMRQVDDRARKNLDVALFDKLVDCLAAHLEVDSKRIYVAGHSAGGIMTNRILRERSKLLAGGIPASGVFELTDPLTPGPLDEMAVLVTWGGDNDAVDGTTSGGKQVPKINFVEQAALSSQHYEQAENVNQMYCKGDNLGHKWLGAIDAVLVEFLLRHPKGAALGAGWKIPSAPHATVSCAEEAAQFVPPVQVTCTAQSKPDCQAYCQSVGDCVVENETVRPVLGPQLGQIGFAGADYSECGGCVTRCEQDLTAGGGADDAVLACFKTETAKGTCGAGVAGAMPFIDAVNACCKDQLASKVCTTLCQAILENTVAGPFFPSCEGWKS